MSRLPKTASVAHAGDGAKLFAPAAERNTTALLNLLDRHAPETGSVLEIASGTGQHIAAFAQAHPNLRWHPSEIDADRRASIDAHVADAGVRNVAPAVPLDITGTAWGMRHGGQAMVLCVNLTHLISDAATRALIAGVTTALDPGGQFLLYGPFKRGGVLTSDGDARFDAQLRGADAAIGYKDDLDILRWFADAGLSHSTTVDMPANNLCLIARRP